MELESKPFATPDSGPACAQAEADLAVFAALDSTKTLLTAESGATRATADVFIYDQLVLEQATGQLTSNLTSACFRCALSLIDTVAL